MVNGLKYQHGQIHGKRKSIGDDNGPIFYNMPYQHQVAFPAANMTNIKGDT